MTATLTSVPMAATDVPVVDFDTEPSAYRHWTLEFDGTVATLTLAVDPHGGLVPGYELKMNSYDLGVDIELYDAVQRLRFEHPEVKAVVVTGGLERMFCAGANIRMLAQSTHAWKVNFCKFTNETRNGVEDATENSGQTYIAALNGTSAGGGYELAAACDQIVLIDDGSSAVSLPEVPLLGVVFANLALVDDPRVAEAAVVGMPDGDGIDKPAALIVRSPGHHNVRADDLIAWCREGLAAFKRPRTVEFATELPKTATGKIQRFRVREMMLELTKSEVLQ